MSGLLLRWQKKEITYDELRVQSIYYFLGLSKGNRNINDLELDIMNSNLFEASKLIDSFFTKTNTDDLEINLEIISNPIKYVKPLANNWYGPEDRLVDTSFGQYIDALNHFKLYHRSSDFNHLISLMATYYKPKKARYNRDKIKKRSSLINEYVDPDVVYAFFLYFSGFHQYVTSSKVIWECEIIDLSIIFSSSNDEDEFKSSIPGLGMKSIAFTLAETKIMGDISKVRSEKLWEVLLLLYDLRKKDLDQRTRDEQQKTK
jgi:hypothetical protein